MLPSPELLLNAVSYGVLIPAVVTVVALLLALRLGGGGEPAAVAAGLAAGFAALAASGQISWDFLTPVEAWDWLPALGLVAAAAACVVEQLGGRPLERWAIPPVVAVLTAWLLIRAQSGRQPVAP